MPLTDGRQAGGVLEWGDLDSYITSRHSQEEEFAHTFFPWCFEMASNATHQVLPPIPPNLNIAQLTTPILIGALLDYFLFGILTLQLYVYNYSFPDDTIRVKILVWFIYVLELAQVCCTGADIHFWFGAGYGNLGRLDETFIAGFDTPLLGSVVAFVVQLFFCYRIWTLRKNNWHAIVSVVIGLVSVVQLVGGCAIGVHAFAVKRFSVVMVDFRIHSYLWLGGEALSDVLIAVTMTFLLLGPRNGFMDQSRNMLTRIVRLVVQTNSLTASFALLSVLFPIALPDTNYFIASTYVLGKLYSNTLLATFNYRIFLRGFDEPKSNQAQYTSSDTFSGMQYTHKIRR